MQYGIYDAELTGLSDSQQLQMFVNFCCDSGDKRICSLFRYCLFYPSGFAEDVLWMRLSKVSESPAVRFMWSVMSNVHVQIKGEIDPDSDKLASILRSEVCPSDKIFYLCDFICIWNNVLRTPHVCSSKVSLKYRQQLLLAKSRVLLLIMRLSPDALRFANNKVSFKEQHEQGFFFDGCDVAINTSLLSLKTLRKIPEIASEYVLPVGKPELHQKAYDFGLGNTHLMYDVWCQPCDDMLYVRMISERMAVNLRNRKGNTALHAAVMCGFDELEKVERLLSLGAEFNIPNDDNLTALDLATQMKRQDLIEAFQLSLTALRRKPADFIDVDRASVMLTKMSKKKSTNGASLLSALAPADLVEPSSLRQRLRKKLMSSNRKPIGSTPSTPANAVKVEEPPPEPLDLIAYAKKMDEEDAAKAKKKAEKKKRQKQRKKKQAKRS